MSTKLDLNLIDIFVDRFVNRFDVIDYQDSFYDRKNEKTVFMYKPYWFKSGTEEELRMKIRAVVIKHLHGRKSGVTLGIPCLDLNNCCKFILFDDDTDSDVLDRLQAWHKAHGWFALREGKRFNHKTNKWKAGHLILLFDKPVLASSLKILANTMMEQAKVIVPEVYPRQEQLTEDRPLGNVVKLPLGIHRKPDARLVRAWFDDCPIKKVSAQLEWLSQQPLNNAEVAMRLAHDHRPLPKPIYLKPFKRKSISEDDEAVITKEGFINFISYACAQGFKKNWDDTKPETPEMKKFLTGPCPLCIASGHDLTHEHMWVNAKTGAAGCWNCGKERFRDICRVIRNRHKVA